MNMPFDENWALTEAVRVANMSKCKSQRGVILWNRNLGLLSEGYNRPPLPFVCDGSEECRKNCGITAVHAEQNAILDFIKKGWSGELTNCEMIHVKVVNGEPVFSVEPSCWQCSKLILEVKLLKMWLYLESGLKGYTAEEFHTETLKNCGYERIH